MVAFTRARVPALLLLGGVGVRAAAGRVVDGLADDGGDCDALLQIPRRQEPLDAAAMEFEALVQGGELTLVANKSYAFAHEGPVYLPEQDAVFFVSNRLNLTTLLESGAKEAFTAEAPDQFIEMSTISLKSHKVTLLPQQVWLESIVMGNGAFPDPQNANAVLVLSQGNLEKTSGIFRLDTRTIQVETVLDQSDVSDQSQFNSPNDIVVDPKSGALLLTDPAYGFYQGFRPRSGLGNWLWIYPPGANCSQQQPAKLRVGADRFTRPNGLAFTDGGDTLLVTDTGYFPGAGVITERSLLAARRKGGSADLFVDIATEAPRTTYAYHVERAGDGSIAAISSERVLSTAQFGAPDGIKVDCEGRVYTGVGNGVEVHRGDGTFLGLIHIEAGAANFVLVPRGRKTQLVTMSETEIYSMELNTRTCVVAR